VNPDSIEQLLGLPDPALLAATAALHSQQRGLAEIVARLERLRAHLPGETSGAVWRGPAQSAYRAGVAEIGRSIDEALWAATEARRCTARAISTMAGHGA
jgi:hypothetical protein